MCSRATLTLRMPTALDLFAGTGEHLLSNSVSRGCKQVVSVEADRDHANFIRQCFKKLNEDRDILVRGDVFRFLKSCRQKFDFIFADPPYALRSCQRFPDLVLNGDLLHEDGIFVFEHGKNYDFSDHPDSWNTEATAASTSHCLDKSQQRR